MTEHEKWHRCFIRWLCENLERNPKDEGIIEELRRTIRLMEKRGKR